MGAVRQLCNNGVVLKNGQLDFIGTAEECVNRYVSENIQGLGAEWNSVLRDGVDFQVTRVRVLSSNGFCKDSFSCDEDIHIYIEVVNRNHVPGIWGYMRITKEDGTIALVSDSNDITINGLSRLPIGKSNLEIIIPKRLLAPAKYSLYLNFTSRQNASGFSVDSPHEVCTFALTDDVTTRGNSRQGCISTLLEWSIK